MAIFPDIAPDYGYSLKEEFLTDRLGPSDGNYTQRRSRSSSGLMTARLRYGLLTSVDERVLVDFCAARQGGYDNFIFFDFAARAYPTTALGTGDGATTIWTLGARDVTDETISFDGVDNGLFAYTVGNRTGADGQDQIIFSPNTPTATVVMTIAYTGKKYFSSCVFENQGLLTTRVIHGRDAVSEIIIKQVKG